MRIFLLALLFAAACGRAPEAADRIVSGGTIYTFQNDDGGPVVEALAIRDGAVVATGSAEEIERYVGDATERVDLEGGFGLPGLTDAHTHLFNLGRLLDRVSLRGTGSVDEILELVAARDRELPEGEWLFGRGWDQNDWAQPFYPNRGMLDAVVADRPVYLERIDGHAGWANSAALRAAGISATTPDPEGGEIVRDPGTGEPIGIVIDAAENLVHAAMPEETPEQLDRMVALAVAECLANGLVGVHEMGVTLAEWAALQRAEAQGALPLRVSAYLGGEGVLDAYAGGPLRGDASVRLHLVGVKYYVDGALGSRGAALLEDYSDRPGHDGLLRHEPERFVAQVEKAVRRGFPVAIHAIGDRGNRVALNAIEHGHAAARSADPSLPQLELARHRVEHVQLLHPDDFGRFAALGIYPSMQPTHCTSDMPWAPSRVGPERIRGGYAWRTLRDSGCVLPLGSDFPVEEVNPLLGIYAAITRRGLDGEPEDGWSPEQCLRREEAVLGFTAWAAEAVGVAEWGRLRIGDRADLTVFDRDPMHVAVDEIPGLQLRRLLIDGEVY